MNRNTHYMAVFKNPRDKTGIRTVLLQAFSSLWQEALTLFQEATQQPFGYFWLDLHQPWTIDIGCGPIMS